MKKLVLGIFAVLIFLAVVYADANSTVIDKAYLCLKNKTAAKSNCVDMSVEEQEFALLALSYDSTSQNACKSALIAKSDNSQCWPSGSCTLKSTALATIALDRINVNTDAAEAWLLRQKANATGLTWYLEIDTNEASSCNITYSGTSYNVAIGADKKFTSGAGSCLIPARSNYFLQVADACFGRDFTISCNKDFITTLLYTKQSALYVSSVTHSASAGGTASEKVDSYCFNQGGTCNYEGSLWATLALQIKDRDISDFLPYLITSAEDNPQYFPDAFLYMLTNDQSFRNNVVELQNPTGYWELSATIPYQKFYDSSLGILSLQGTSIPELEKSKTYFLSLISPTSSGCWTDGIKETAFLLYAGWPKSPAISGGGGGSGTGNCNNSGYYCVPTPECISADRLSTYSCSAYGLSYTCCRNNPIKTCEEQGGIRCSSTQTCDVGYEIEASDSSKCCETGKCRTTQTQCERNSFECKSLCSSNEESKNYTCNSGNRCCGIKSAAPAGSSLWWLWLLIILIILVVLAIIFRNQLRIWLFRIKNKFSKGPATSERRPPFPPSQQPFRPMFRPMPQQQRFMPRPASQQRTSNKNDEEFNDTIKKLKEMSK